MGRELRPNSTQIPDLILDFWLSEMSGGELKVVLYIARRTYGFGKERDNISLTQICSGIRKRDGKVLDTGTGLSRSSVARAIKTLEERGIVLRQINMSETTNEHEESTYQLNLAWKPQVPGGTGGNGSGEEDSESEAKEVVPKSDYPVSKSDRGWFQNRTTGSPKIEPGVVPKSNSQETDQETVQETAATEAAAELEKELLILGMNPLDAKRLSQKAPDECSRQMAYLAFHNPPRRNPGGWLVEAIPGRYPPPPEYIAHERKCKMKAVEAASTIAESAEDSRRAILWSRYLSYLRLSVDRLTTSQPWALAEFEEWQAKEKLKYAKFGLSTRPFDDEGERLKRCADFFGRARPNDTWSFDQWMRREAQEQTVSVSP